MFLLDSLFVSGLRWVLDKVSTAVDAEMSDDSVLREALLAAEMRRESGEISDEEFRRIETDLLARIRAIRERRDGGSGPIAFGRGEAAQDAEVRVEATLAGEFHAEAPAETGSALPAAGAPETRRVGRLHRPVRRGAPSRRRRSSR